MKIACILFAYNRPGYLRRAIRTHRKVEGIDYYAFIDHSPMQDRIYKIIDASGIYDNIIKRERNYGLNKNIIEGIDSIFLQNYDAVIVLEDDLLLAGDAIVWLKVMLKIRYFMDRKEWRDNIFSIGCDKGEQDSPQFRCHAWGIWQDRWDAIDWLVTPKEKNRDSWDVIVNAYMQKAGLFCFCSDKQRVKHIGYSGVHYTYLDIFSIRRWIKKYKEWKNDYYRDKDLLMKKDRGIISVFRIIRGIANK